MNSGCKGPPDILPAGRDSDRKNTFACFFLEYLRELEQYDADYRRLADWVENDRAGFLAWISQKCLRPLVISRSNGPLGLALLARAPFTLVTPGCDYRMGEFYILPEFRRHGWGERAARRIFALFPGAWEIFQLPANTAAVQFWRNTLASYDHREEWIQGRPRHTFTCPGPNTVFHRTIP